MARLFSFRSSFTLSEREGYGLRGWAGKPTHPPLSDVPVSCYILAAAFDVASLVAAGRHAGWARDAFVAATWVLAAGLGAGALAATTGFLDRPAATARTQVRRTVNAHAATMKRRQCFRRCRDRIDDGDAAATAGQFIERVERHGIVGTVKARLHDDKAVDTARGAQ